ncbi:hypothetical protein OH76DRAFT_1417166 [Lentinus brumalis]|uniref:Uncharacterized protein n=1 Tax=Lentinus brumalis TaxID=2498619 RepID=A0A371DH08_9APHY|nr:hypothetical protein OH76DRAFT_1417166 [Polyporus brumalis]
MSRSATPTKPAVMATPAIVVVPPTPPVTPTTTPPGSAAPLADTVTLLDPPRVSAALPRLPPCIPLVPREYDDNPDISSGDETERSDTTQSDDTLSAGAPSYEAFEESDEVLLDGDDAALLLSPMSGLKIEVSRSPSPHPECGRQIVSPATLMPEGFLKCMKEVQESQLSTQLHLYVTQDPRGGQSLRENAEKIHKERRSMEETHVIAADAIQVLQSKLTKAHRDIATLQAQHIAGQGLMERMANDIAEVLAVQDDMGCRLARLEESEQQMSTSAEKTRELMASLDLDDQGMVDSESVRYMSLAEELALIGELLPQPVTKQVTSLIVVIQDHLRLALAHCAAIHATTSRGAQTIVIWMTAVLLVSGTWFLGILWRPRRDSSDVGLSDHPVWESL